MQVRLMYKVSRNGKALYLFVNIFFKADNLITAIVIM